MDAQRVYRDIYARWQRDPLGFWGEAAAAIDGSRSRKPCLDPKACVTATGSPTASATLASMRWTAMSMWGCGDRPAASSARPAAGEKCTITYHRLLTETQVLGDVRPRDLGVGKLDGVILYMPMVPETVIASAWPAHRRHSFGWLSRRLPRELAAPASTMPRRKSFLSASGRVEARPHRCLQAVARRGDRVGETQARGAFDPAAAAGASEPDRGPRRAWKAMCDYALIHARSAWDCERMLATDPLYILYTSRTTGRPKQLLVRDNGGHLVALQWSMKISTASSPSVGGPRPTSAGWSGIPTSSMRRCFTGATSILYEGKPVGTPDAPRVLARHRRALRRRDVHRAGALDRVPRHQERRPARQIIRAARFEEIPHAVPGRRARRSADAGNRVRRRLKVPVLDHWWQTETGAIAGNRWASARCR